MIHETCADRHALGKFQAAESLENCALRFRNKAIDVVKSSKAAQVMGEEAVAGHYGGEQHPGTLKKKKSSNKFGSLKRVVGLSSKKSSSQKLSTMPETDA